MTPPAKGGVAAAPTTVPADAASAAEARPTQLAKAALRRLAQDKLEPTPDNYARAYQAKVMMFYRRHHIDRLVKMVMKPAGLDPSGRLSQCASAVLWRVLTMRAGTGKEPLKAA